MKKYHQMQSKSSVEKIDILKRRASRIKTIRKYFEKQNVLEVDTPILSEKAVSDIHIESIGATVNNKQNFLHTSPEFCMKEFLQCALQTSTKYAKYSETMRKVHYTHQNLLWLNGIE